MDVNRLCPQCNIIIFLNRDRSGIYVRFLLVSVITVASSGKESNSMDIVFLYEFKNTINFSMSHWV